MDDRCLGGNRPLTRSSLAVYKDGQEMTGHFAGLHNTNNGEILDVEGETLFDIMQAIAKENPLASISPSMPEEEDLEDSSFDPCEFCMAFHPDSEQDFHSSNCPFHK